MRMRRFVLAFLVLGSATAIWAQDNPPEQVPDDGPAGPGKGVARISLINGEVSVRRGNSGEVTAAALNAPLMSGDTLLTGANARAELQFDASSMVRIAANSEVHMGDLQYRRNQMQVAIGLVTFTVFPNSQSQNEIDLPSVAVRPKSPGAYRILVNQDGSAEITVRAGAADIANPRGTQALQAGQTMLVRGSQDDPEFQVIKAIQQDDWDRWNVQRDRELMGSNSRQHVNADINGAEELDQHGQWQNDAQYGQVWVPQVDQNWAPYQDGRWVWGDDYGWTWVSTDPWGWAPYHYGRWYRSHWGWAWWPGPVVGPCYWSPALVGFFGFGGRVGFGFGFASIGWVPLAPFEPFHRWWGPGFRGGFGFRNTVIVNNFNVYNTYRNARVAGGVMGVNATAFGRGGARFSAVNGAELRSAGMVHGMLPVTPERASLRMSDRSVNISNFRQSSNTRFFSSARASSSRSVPFEQQRQAVQQASRGNSFSGSNGGGWRPAQSSQSRSGNDANWQRFNSSGSSPSQGGYRQPQTNTGGSRGPSYGGGPSYSAPRGSPGYNPPSYSAPRYSAPSYSAPRSYNPPSYSAPRSSPSYSSGGGGGGYRGGGGSSGGSGHSSGGGGGHSSGGGGGGGHHR